MFGEKEFFFFNHMVLPLVPLAYIYNGSITLTTRSTSFATHVQWWGIACCCFAIFYFTLTTVLGVYAGLNLNYMLHPLPGQALLAGKWYRITSIALCAVEFALNRCFSCLVERLLVLFSKSSSMVLPLRHKRRHDFE